MNTVSNPSDRWRFINAIWNSYSKSLTALSPRMLSVAPTFLAKSTSSPSNWVTSTHFWSAVERRISSTLSSVVNSAFLDEFTATATMRWSTNSQLLRIKSSCPLVIGSKLPAYTAVVTTSFLAAVEGDCRRTILARYSLPGHCFLRRVLDTQHLAERFLKPPLGQPLCISARIGRIGERDIEIERPESFGKRERGLSMDGGESLSAKSLDILLQSADARGVLFNEIRRDCSAGQCFESERARACIKIEHVGTRQVQLQDVHPRFTNAVEGGTHQRAGRRADFPSAPTSRDYSHNRISAMRAWRKLSPGN